jgi:hypothetical protein
MKKSLIAVILLIIFQVTFLIGSLALIVNLRSDCSMVQGQMGMWQCSGNADPALPAYMLFLLLPPVVVKLLFKAAKRTISWKRVIALHVVTAAIVGTLLFMADNPDCGCAPPGGI